MLFAAAAAAEERGNTLVEPQLLVDCAAIAPGASFRGGVLYKIRPGWHIYWKNSGDSGAPTALSFALPDGFRVSELRWPTPHRFVQEGPIVDFGYIDSVLIWATITAPKDLQTGQNSGISVRTSWLVCSDRCLPGEANLTINLPVAAKSEPANAELFESFQRQLPIDINSTASPLRATFSGQMPPDQRRGEFSITLRWVDASGSDIEFCPDPEPALTVDDVRVTPTKRPDGISPQNGPIISFRATVLKGKSLSSPRLPAVVAYTDAKGVRHGVGLDIPLRPTAP